MDEQAAAPCRAYSGSASRAYSHSASRAYSGSANCAYSGSASCAFCKTDKCLKSKKTKTSERIHASVSAIGPENKMPSSPRNIGRIKRSGIRKRPCRDADKMIPNR